MKTLIFTAALMGISTPCFAQSQIDLDSQVAAVAAAQNLNWSIQQQQVSAEQEAEARAEHRAWAAQQQRYVAARADKLRDQVYTDQLRSIQIQEEQTQLEMDKAKADRANAYIDQDLARDKAQTDVIQSNADANRNVSVGIKTYLGNSVQQPTTVYHMAPTN
jgi:hypothetical protein